MKRSMAITVVGVGLAALLLGSVSAFAAPKPKPVVVQTPLSANKIPQFVQPLDLLDLGGLTQVPVALGKINALGIGSTNIDVSLCEFQSNVLPPGTPVVGAVPGVAPATWVWGYQVEGSYVPGLLPHSYLGPVVVAERDTPTQMTFFNRLPDANQANVMAYATSTDQTLIWGDPVGLNAFPPPTLVPAVNFGLELNDVLARGADARASRADARRLQRQLRLHRTGGAPAAGTRLHRAGPRRGAHPRRRGPVGARRRPRLLVYAERHRRPRLLHPAREEPAGPAPRRSRRCRPQSPDCRFCPLRLPT